ncbi:threonine-phosphate decarboxylase [Gilvimarinus sp. DA14]|uniref:threonine-phosphate decarboxylase n=1 Tax=Gilvimarinus sp. DA14 TaxID=2956798 RepID=UPI0020B87A51|nr:threonine-phosphate decarboxylase [Gilvimarinus sp. DA14]UTF60102.1 pyridoxal phosphate-dependent class II aminotransferase [Gilvimarinus sp. DA14]
MSDASEHGGNLQAATKCFGLPHNGWQDLSTGISPWGYPVNNVPDDVWQNLPVNSEPLLHAAQKFYGVDKNYILPLPGSQAAISSLPRLLPAARVALPSCGYHEHEYHWTNAGHIPVFYTTMDELLRLTENGAVEHAVVINPNNPTGQIFGCDILQKVYHKIAGVLLVDEAFMDWQPENTMAAFVATLPRLIVLRSVGKFFGLAGIRLGFVLSANGKVEQIKAAFEPWAVNGPAMWVAERALTDFAWQKMQRRRIDKVYQTLKHILQNFIRPLERSVTLVGTGLFVSLAGDSNLLGALHKALALRGIYTRWGYQCAPSATAYLRIGLPPDDGVRLQAALHGIREQWEQQY